MRVRELIEHLNELNPDREVYISSDEEGNNHRRLYMAQEGWYHEEAGWSGGPGPVADEDIGPEYDEEECFKAVTLW